MRTIGVVLVCVVVSIACGKKKGEPATGSGSAAAGSAAAGSAAAPPADLPPSTAPPTPEVLAKFDAACDAGTGKACFDAGMRRAQGMGAPRDRVAAIAWLEKGCKLDDVESCGLLAGFLGAGDEGVTNDAQRAFDLHTKACPRRPASCTVLASYYGRGEVVPQDEAKAMAMLEQGCTAGDGRGCEDLANRLATGDGIAKDAARAVETARKACDLDPFNCETLGAFYIGGTGVAPDRAQGESLIDKACKAGSKKACEGLQILRGQ